MTDALSPAQQIVEYLDGAGAGTLGGVGPGWAIYAFAEPSSPENVITVYDGGGGEPEPDQDLFRPNFQVRVRALDYTEGYAKQVQIRDLLIAENAVIPMMGIFLTQDVTPIGKDDNDRHITTANYRALRTKEQET